MPTAVTWNGTAYSVPNAGELNWATLTNFLVDLGNNAQTTNFQKLGSRIAVSTPVTVSAATDSIINVDTTVIAAAVTVNLPAGAAGQVFYIVDGSGAAATNNITIDGNGAETINGASTHVIRVDNGGVCIGWDGTEWRIISDANTGNLSGPLKIGGSGAATEVAHVESEAGQGNGFLVRRGTSVNYDTRISNMTGTGEPVLAWNCQPHASTTDTMIRTTGGPAGYIHVDDSTAAMAFYMQGGGAVGSSLSTTPKMTLDNTGQWGLGTDPGHFMHARNDADSITQLRIQNSFAGTTAASELNLNTNSGNGRIFKTSLTNTDGGGADTLTVQNDGSGGVYLATGGTTWLVPSDMRYKTKVSDFTNGLDKILNLSTFLYTLNDDPKERQHLGLSAQEVVKVIPEVVSGAEFGKMGIAYTSFVPVLIDAIKELSTRIKELEAKHG